MDIRNTERDVASLKRKVAEMQEENEDLRDEIRRERRRTRRMMFQRYDDSSHGQEAECAE
jgi:regulator of replication initiation timing